MSFNRKFVLNSGRYSSLELLSNQGLGLISFFILVRVMSKNDFGIWILYVSTTTLLEQARIGFIKNGFIKYLAGGDETLQEKVFASSLLLNLLVFVVTAGITMIFALYVGPDIWNAPILKPMFLWYVPYAFLLTFYLQFKILEQAHMDFKGSFYTAFFRRIFFISAIVVIITVRQPIHLMQLVYLNLASIVLGLGVSYILARKKIRLTFSWDISWIKKLASFGSYTLGTNVSSMVMRNIDQFMLGTFSDKIYLAFYNTAVRVTNLIEIPTNAMSSIVFPKSVSMARENKTQELKEIYEKSVAIIFLFVLPIVVTVLMIPEFFIYIIAGQGYLDAANYLRVTILFALFVPFMRQSGTVLDAIGKPKINFYLTIFAAVINIFSNLMFIHFFGPMGAAYGTLASYSVILVVNQIYVKRFLNVEIMQIIRYIFYYYQSGLFLLLKKLREKFSF